MESTSVNRDYIAWRYKNNAQGKRDLLLSDSIATLSLEKQCVYRRKFLSLLAGQIAFVASIVCFATYQPDINSFIVNNVQDHFEYIPISFLLVVCMLGILYIVRDINILNAITCICFSISQAAFGIVCQTLFDSKIVVFNFGFTFFYLIIMITLSRTFIKPKQKPVKLEGLENAFDDKRQIEHSFALNSIAASFIACSVMFAVAILIYNELLRQHEIMTLGGFVGSLFFQGIITIWFAWDISILYKLLNPERYKYGIIYVYVDFMTILSLLSIFALFSLTAILFSIICSDALCGGDSNLNELSNCCCIVDYTLWDSGDCSNCSDCTGGFRVCLLEASIYLHTNQHQQDAVTDEDILPAYIEQI